MKPKIKYLNIDKKDFKIVADYIRAEGRMLKIKKHFEKEILKNTCFSSIKELMEDKTPIDVNTGRALMAVELRGIWRGLNIALELMEKEKI